MNFCTSCGAPASGSSFCTACGVRVASPATNPVAPVAHPGPYQQYGPPSHWGERQMTMGEAVRTCLSKYAVFSGRATRAEYWWWTLAYWCALIVAVIFDALIGSHVVFTILVLLAGFLPSLAAFVRRLHDTGRSGAWWFLGLVPFAGIALLVFTCEAGNPMPNQYGVREPLPATA